MIKQNSRKLGTAAAIAAAIAIPAEGLRQFAYRLQGDGLL